MRIKHPKFLRQTSPGLEFSKTLSLRVNDYFKRNNLSKYGDHRMVIKTIVMLAVFLIPLTILSTGLVTSVAMLFAMYIISALGKAGVGMGVMHDALHGSYSRNQRVNKYMGYTMNLIGANASLWKIQHNVLHHTYTNIEHVDDDISPPEFILRFSPHSKRYWLHRFQHFYGWLFYGLATLSWATVKDFTALPRYKKMGFFKKNGEFRKVTMQVVGWKLVYFSFILILPIIAVPLPAWIVILAFLTMHFVTGFLISVVFQLAHVVPATNFPLPDENGMIGNDWTLHQMATTSNFAPRSAWLTWLIGGLNYQVEHHLLPHICHIHYRKLSAIVSETAREFGVPYNIKKTFFGALWDHCKMLRQLGKMESAMVVK